MIDPSRMTVDEFFAWHEHVEGRYELVDGHIVPHPDYVTPNGLAAPSNQHAAVLANLTIALGSQLRPFCQVYSGGGAIASRLSANVPDLAVSCDSEDLATRNGLRKPRFIFEIISPSTKRIDHGRKVAEYLAIESLEAYIVLDPERRSITVYRAAEGPQTWHDGDPSVVLASDLDVSFSVFL